MRKNYLVTPLYYQHTSFEDIVQSLRHCLNQENIELSIVGNLLPRFNNLSTVQLDNSIEFANAQGSLVQNLISVIKEPANVLFLDFFCPGIEMFKLHCHSENLPVKTGALLHGGSFVPGDFYSQHQWMKTFEAAYFESFDVVYAPSLYMQRQCRKFKKSSIKVFPWGLDGFEFDNRENQKVFDVVFPHRLSHDKGIDDFITIVRKMPKVRFCVTVPQEILTVNADPYIVILNSLPNVTIKYGENSKDHISTLASSKIVLSCAKQEGFGYAVHKAVRAGCYPIVPDRLCYPEYFKKRHLYSSKAHALELIESVLSVEKKSDMKTPILKKKICTFKYLINDFFTE